MIVAKVHAWLSEERSPARTAGAPPTARTGDPDRTVALLSVSPFVLDVAVDAGETKLARRGLEPRSELGKETIQKLGSRSLFVSPRFRKLLFVSLVFCGLKNIYLWGNVAKKHFWKFH